MSTLNSTVAPNLPVGPTQFDSRYQDQLNNVQRLYYNQIDNVTQGLLGPLGGQYLNFPHISASDSTDQYATANNTPTVVKWNTLDSGAGFTLSAPGSATCLATGIFKITYSAQLANTANAAHDAAFWLRVNGVDVPNSGTLFTMPARKSAGVPSYFAAYSEVTFTVEAGDVIQLYWATDQAYSTTGPVDGVYIEFLPIQTSPYPRPAIPSVIGSITFVCNTPS
jgi:hypothetical protein